MFGRSLEAGRVVRRARRRTSQRYDHFPIPQIKVSGVTQIKIEE